MNSIDIEEFYQEIGRKVKEMRLSHKPRYSQDALGKLVNMSRTSIVNIEQGKHHIQLHTLFLIAQKLHVSVNNLIPQNLIHESLDMKTSKELSKREKESVEKTLSSYQKKEVRL